MVRLISIFIMLFSLLLPLAACAAEGNAPAFDILEYVVEGNTVLPARDIERAVYPHLGEKKTIASVEAAREALEKKYHSSGYLTVFVSIPEQKVEGGIVRLQVVQGEVSRLRVTGSRYYSLNEIKARVPGLAEGAVPYFPEVQEQLAGLGRTADRKITPVLRPAPEPGKLEVDLKVADERPFHGAAELNNRYSANTTHLRFAANMRWDNLWQKDHSFGISYQSAPESPKDSRAFSLTYSVPLFSGAYAAAYWARTESDVASLGTLGVIGTGDITGFRWIRPLRGFEGFSHNVTLGVDSKKFGQTVNVQGADSFNTPISYLPFTAAWSGDWGSKTGTTNLNIAANFHMRDLVGEETEFANKRFLASSGYFYLRGDVKRVWVLKSGGSLQARGGFQFAAEPLISNEGFVLGGVDTVRGYLESEVIGDRGYFAGLELHSPQLARSWQETLRIEDFHGVAFLDGGSTQVVEPLPAQISRFNLGGAGVGLRLKAWGGFSAMVDLVRAMRDAGTIQAGDVKLHASLRYAF